MVSSTTLMPFMAQRSRRVGVARDGVAGGLPLGRAAPRHPVDERRSWPRRGPRRPAAASRRAASRTERRVHLVVERHEQRHHDRHQQQPVPRAAVAAVRRDRGGRSPGGVVAVDITAPFPGGEPRVSAGRSPGRNPVRPLVPRPRVGARRRGDGHLDPPGQVAVEHVRRHRQPGPLGGEVCHVAQRRATRLHRFRDGVVLEVAGQEDVGAGRGRRAVSEPPLPPQTATGRTSRSGSPATRTPPTVAGRTAAARAANSRRVTALLQVAHPAEAGPRVAVRRLQRHGVPQPEDGGQRVVDAGVGGAVGVGVRDERARRRPGSAGGPGGPWDRRRARRAPG